MRDISHFRIAAFLFGRIELRDVQVSDTTDDDSSTTVGQLNIRCLVPRHDKKQ